MLSLEKRIRMSFEDVNKWLPEFSSQDVLHRSARQYYTDVGDSGSYFTGVISDEVEQKGRKMTEDHIRAPQSMFKLRYKYEMDSLTDFQKFTEHFLLDRYTIGVTPEQNVKVKHRIGGIIPESMVYQNLTSWWWTRKDKQIINRSKEFPLLHVFPKWYLHHISTGEQE